MRRPARTLRSGPKRGHVPPPSTYRQGRRSRARFSTLDVAQSFDVGFTAGLDVGQAGSGQRERLVEEYLRGRSLESMSAFELDVLGSEFVALARLAIDKAVQARTPRLRLVGDDGELTEAGRALIDDLTRKIDIPLDGEEGPS